MEHEQTGVNAREVMMSVRNLNKTFPARGKSKGTQALKDICFEAYRREFLCIVGASGCGKSTLVRILAGLESKTSGQLLVDGKEVKGPGQDRGMVFQGYTLFPWLSVKRNVMFGPRTNGMNKREAETQANEWIKVIGLEKFADCYPFQLSGGMKQRVAIARALANNPRVLLMDEPFGALDAHTRAKMQAHLIDVWKRVDITVVFITHDLDEALLLADRILVLKPHPGEVAEMVNVPLARPRTVADFSSAEFKGTKARLEQLLYANEDAEMDVLHPR
ncbi:ABC transporter ATP-binding protein [Caballeronia sp. 15711]|uniref:ABC transporter ATP-binding protein n=1 Tax=Caballeronia sp. 15711 TaxID=3391029 RepID=UPI0039E612E2